jgi:hypothetical protein
MDGIPREVDFDGEVLDRDFWGMVRVWGRDLDIVITMAGGFDSEWRDFLDGSYPRLSIHWLMPLTFETSNSEIVYQLPKEMLGLFNSRIQLWADGIIITSFWCLIDITEKYILWSFASRKCTFLYSMQGRLQVGTLRLYFGDECSICFLVAWYGVWGFL